MPKAATIFLIYCFAALIAFACPQKAQAQGTAELQQGVALFNAKKYEEAIGVLTRSAQQGNVRATYYLGLCHQQLRHDDKVVELFQHIRQTYPSSQEALLCNDYLEKLNQNASGAAAAAVRPAQQSDADKLKAQVELLTSAQWKALPETARIPFQMKNGHMYVQAKVNGRYCDIVFDTGASACVMSLHEYPDLFSQADIAKAPSIPVARPHGVDYMKVVAGEVSVDRITRKLTILLTREPGVSVIGQNFFKEYQYEIDGFYVRMTKAPYVSPVADAAANAHSAHVSHATEASDKYSIPFRRQANCMVVDILVNGHSIPTVFDTGCAPDGVVMPIYFMERLGIQKNSDGYYAETAVVGPITRKFARVHFANGLDTLLIGPKFFGDRRYTVDPINNLIKFQY